MRSKRDGRRSIYLEMTSLLLACAVFAWLFFLIMNKTTGMVLDSFVKRSAYNQRVSSQYAENVQTYVTENGIGTDDVWAIADWTNEHQIVLLQLFDEDQLIFDSMFDSEEAAKLKRRRITTHIWGYDYRLQMEDKSVRMYIYGSFDYALYNSAMMAEVFIAAAVAFMLFLLGIRKKIKYIRVLEKEVQLLEGGSLDYQITVSGVDELADLAKGLDTMRVSFLHQIEAAEELSKTNQTMVTQISHDLRTPLTAITLYADILETGQNLTEEQKQIYLDKILRKVRHMKELSDTLLTYYSGGQEQVLPSLERCQTKVLFYDELSDFCSYLQEQGFVPETELIWKDCMIMANDEMISRIMNNVSSNILKYAEKEKPVRISCDMAEKTFYLRIENEICANPGSVTSSGIGLRNIREMMKQMKGDCLIATEKNHFSIVLTFPVVD